MPSEAEYKEYPSIQVLPGAALAWFGMDFFSTSAWYHVVLASGLPHGGVPVFVTIFIDGAPAAVFPMLTCGAEAQVLVTPYTCLWQPLIAPGLDKATMALVLRCFASWCRRFATVRFEAMDQATADCLAAGIGKLVPLRYDHFGNWQATATLGWQAYLASRPGEIREAIRRRGRRLLASGARLRIVSRPDEVSEGIAIYEAVYAKSWKGSEPFPAFNPALMRCCARAGSLRLGLLLKEHEPMAVQFWVVHREWAAVLKLAHDEAVKAFSPGTVLTALMIEHLLTYDNITNLDFGRGDDAYKLGWTEARHQRVGVLLANPTRIKGVAAIARHAAGLLIKEGTKQFGRRSKSSAQRLEYMSTAVS